MNTASTSNAGSRHSGSQTRWTRLVPRDTSAEAQAQYDAWWLGLTGFERAVWWLRRTHMFNEMRLDLIRRHNPGASDAELLALWTEETYRGSVDPGFLARACAAIRAGAAEPAAD